MAEGFFWGQDPNINEELRRRIALQMLSGKKGFPKSVGEGLSAIGDAIGDRGIMSRLAEDEAASEKAGGAAVARLGGPLAYAPTDSVTEAPAAPAASAAPSEPPTPLFTAPEQPASMLRPELPAGLGGASAGGVGPESMYTSPKPLGMPAPAAAPTQAAVPGDRWPQQSAALAGIETGGAKNPYTTLGAVTRTGDRAHGKYQIMGANIPEWTRAALGRPLTPEQFLASPEAQEATARHRFTGYANKYGDEGAAKAWFAGEQGMKNPNATDVHGRLNVGTYGQDFTRRMGQQAGASPRDAVSAQLVAQGQDPVEPPPGQQATLGSPILPQGLSAAPPQQAIRAMPQPQPPVRVAQAGGQPAPIPGYVTPEPEALAQPRVVGPTPMQRQIMQEIQNTPPANRAAVQRALTPYMQQEETRRAAEQVAVNKAWEAQQKTHEALKLKRADQLADQWERINKTHVTVNDKILIPNPRGKPGDPWIDVTPARAPQPPGSPPLPVKPLTEAESKSQKFLSAMILGERQLQGKEKLLANSPLQATLNKFGGNALMDRNYKIARGAADFSVAANLRDISGAVIGETEQVRQYKMNMPAFGDSDKEIEAKRERRKAIMDSMYGGLGEGGRALVDHAKAELFKKHEEEQAKANEVMNRKLGQVQPGYVSTNRKTGERRVFDGKNWLEYYE